MNHWHFIVGAYVVTAVVIVAEIFAVVLRHRLARSQAEAARDAPLAGQAGPRRNATDVNR